MNLSTKMAAFGLVAVTLLGTTMTENSIAAKRGKKRPAKSARSGKDVGGHLQVESTGILSGLKKRPQKLSRDRRTGNRAKLPFVAKGQSKRTRPVASQRSNRTTRVAPISGLSEANLNKAATYYRAAMAEGDHEAAMAIAIKGQQLDSNFLKKLWRKIFPKKDWSRECPGMDGIYTPPPMSGGPR
tara:strand:- start:173 stop:727 length:555 start_codon:yes stop_codon:yes gene_type:complete